MALKGYTVIHRKLQCSRVLAKKIRFIADEKGRIFTHPPISPPRFASGMSRQTSTLPACPLPSIIGLAPTKIDHSPARYLICTRFPCCTRSPVSCQGASDWTSISTSKGGWGASAVAFAFCSKATCVSASTWPVPSACRANSVNVASGGRGVGVNVEVEVCVGSGLELTVASGVVTGGLLQACASSRQSLL